MTFTDYEIRSLLKLVQEASEAIMDVYQSGFEVVNKSDQSPLTLADLKSNEILTKGITHLFPDIPIISEENKNTDYNDRKNYSYFWLIDPLDGTKEFVKRNGEFTINISLVHENSPVFGIIAQPINGRIWHNLKGNVVSLENGIENPLKDLGKELSNNKLSIVASRSHLNEETENLIQRLESLGFEIDIVNAGSALKFCMICENKAHIYPRLAPTMEWDTAAGQALVNSLGGYIIDLNTNKQMQYNKINLLNSPFIAFHPALNYLSEQLM